MSAFQDFLRSKITKDKELITHTRIPDKNAADKFGGSYYISDSDLPEFYRLYHNEVFVNQKIDHLTEKQLDIGPLAIDIDFRYHNKERAYTNENIIDFIESIIYLITDIFNIYHNFQIYVFEKKNINIKADQIKDGIHFIIGVSMDKPSKELLRNALLSKMDNVWADLKPQLTNSWESVIDEGVMKATTNWQLIGSRKPGHQPYTLTKIYECKRDNDNDFELEYTDGTLFDFKNNIHLLSVQYQGHPVLKIRDSYQDEYDKIKNKSSSIPNKKKLKIVNSVNDDMINHGDIKNMTMLQKALQQVIGKDSENSIDFKLKEIHDYVMCLPENYFGQGSFDKWIRVGWALRNTDFRMFPTWMLFSSQSPSFSFDQVAYYYSQWCSWNHKNEECLTARSIMYWAKNESLEEYNRIKKSSIEHYIDESVRSSTEYDIAIVLHQWYKDLYVCVSIKNNIWYEYNNQRWIESDSGISLREQISATKGIWGIYTQKLHQLRIEHSAMDAEAEADRANNLKNKITRLSVICIDLKKTTFKNNVMREARDLFYIRDFISLLDSKNHILCFTNGVIDFNERKFRQGLPEDYTSKSTNIPYVKHDPVKDKDIIEEILTFMEQLFPVAELRHYMWDHAASVLLGKNTNQTFNIYTGAGRNGKSKFVELMSKILGEYKGTVPVTLITQKRNSIGSTSSEIVQLMGVRYAVMQEPSVGDQINEGIMKEITGGDPIQGRALFKDTVTFIPQFKLVVCTNTLFDIKSNDDGTWRRIRVCDFQSVFTENPVDDDESKPYQFKVDKNIDIKFEKWKTIFMSMLIERAYKTEGDVIDCKIVMAKSNNYRMNQDHYTEFIKTHIKKDPDGVVKEKDIYEQFKDWWTLHEGRKVPKGKELFDYITKQFGNKASNKPLWRGISIIQQYESETEELDELS